MAILTGHARSGRRSAAGALLLAALLLVPAPGSAQNSQAIQFDAATEARLFGVNALLGGVSALLAARVREDPLLPGFVTGVSGGALIYAGKRIAVDPRPGTGFLGRQAASVGGSIVGNVVAGRRGLDRLAFAAGPVRAYVGADVAGVDWRLDALGTVAAAWGFMRGAELELGKSLSSGAVVFRGSTEQALPATIFYHRKASPEREAYVLAHEQVHILQYDQSFLSWGGPYEELIGRQYPSLGGVLDRVEFNLPILATALALTLLVWEQHDEQPWEKEAMYLGRTR